MLYPWQITSIPTLGYGNDEFIPEDSTQTVDKRYRDYLICFLGVGVAVLICTSFSFECNTKTKLLQNSFI